MSIARALSVSLILSTALTVGACKGGDKTKVSDSGPAKALKVGNVSDSAIESLFDVKTRKVSDADAETALKKLGLAESGDAALKWDKRSGKSGNYVYTDLTATSDDGETVTFDKLELTGVHMDGDDATFDTIKAYGMSAESDEGTAKIAKLALSGPSPALAAAITDGIANASKTGGLDDMDMDIDFEDDDIYFDAMSLEGVNMTADEANVNIKSLAWGKKGEDGKGLFHLEDLSVDGTKPGDPKVKIRLASANATGIDTDQFKEMTETSRRMGKRPNKAMGDMFSGGAFAKSFDSMSFKDLSVEVDTLSITSNGGQGDATEKGGVTTIRQVLEPLVIKFNGAPEDKDMMSLYTGLQSLGYDEMVFSMAQTSTMNAKTDTVTITDSFIDLKDGFRFSYDMKASGISALSDKSLSKSEREDAAENMEIANLNLALADKSMLDRAIKLIAEQQGSSPMMLKMQAKGGLMMLSGSAQGKDQQEMAAQLSTALNEFIDNGGTLKIGINPTTPISGKKLQSMNPAKMDLGELGFYAKTE